jgi:predicted O-methyltransferase YrrM
MKKNEIIEKTEGIPFILKHQKDELYDFIITEKPNRILELGFAHGVSACVMAAALDEVHQRGLIDTIDSIPAKNWQNKVISIEDLSSKLGLSKYINIYREAKSYNWWLKKELENKRNNPRWLDYDFVFIDGSHNWTIDGFAFFLVEKLLRPGGWILFDDLGYSYSQMINIDGRRETAGVSHYDMSQDEIDAKSVGLIFELLVKEHERFENFSYSFSGYWGWAQKTKDAYAKEIRIIRKYSLYDDLVKLKNKIKRSFA